MDIRLLEDIGLTNVQAKTYASLVERGESGAPAIATTIGESRTNAYKVLDKLCELGLANKEQIGKRVRYFPANPAALEQLVNQQTNEVQLRDRKLKAAMPGMLDFFFARSEQPGIRFFQGKDGIEKIYKDQLITGKPIRIVRSWKDRDFFGKGVYSTWRKRPAKYGIPTIMHSPDVPDANNNPELDKKLLFSRTWMDREDYTAPVEWDIYGDKVSVISFGEEAIGMIIESPQIAESMRQMFEIMGRGLRANPEYSSLPKHGRMEDDKYVMQDPEYRQIMRKIKHQA